jgi:hypothetical protein
MVLKNLTWCCDIRSSKEKPLAWKGNEESDLFMSSLPLSKRILKKGLKCFDSMAEEVGWNMSALM